MKPPEAFSGDHDFGRFFLRRGLRIPTMALPEIAAEKVRALMTRSQARDLYDLWFLLRKGVRLDSKLLEQKLAWRKEDAAFRPEAVDASIDRLGSVWSRDLKPVMNRVPRFERVALEVRTALGRVQIRAPG